MAKFRIIYVSPIQEDEEVEADDFKDSGKWIDFVVAPDEGERTGSRTILRIKAAPVSRIERLP